MAIRRALKQFKIRLRDDTDQVIYGSLANLVLGFHLMIVGFILLGWLANSTWALTLHALFIPVVIMHWWVNDNSCVLTKIENRLRERALGDNVPPDREKDQKFVATMFEATLGFVPAPHWLNFGIYFWVILAGVVSVAKIFWL